MVWISGSGGSGIVGKGRSRMDMGSNFDRKGFGLDLEKGKGVGGNAFAGVWMPAWGAGKSMGKGKGKGKAPRIPYPQLTVEQKAEIRQKHTDRAMGEGRAQVGNQTYDGVLVGRYKKYGWIKPTNFLMLPKNVQDQMTLMTAELKTNAQNNGRDSTFNESVIYVRMCDVAEGVRVDQGMAVKFKVYVDAKGVGAYDVNLA